MQLPSTETAELVQFIKDSLLYVLIALTGGLAHLCWTGFRNVGYSLSSIFMSGFAGFCAYGFLTQFDFTPGAEAGIVGICGFGGGKIVEAIQKRLLNRIRDTEVPPPPRRQRKKKEDDIDS